MTYKILLELRGEPNSANPSDYGYGVDWQYLQKDLINAYWESEALQESMTLGEYLDSMR